MKILAFAVNLVLDNKLVGKNKRFILPIFSIYYEKDNIISYIGYRKYQRLLIFLRSITLGTIDKYKKDYYYRYYSFYAINKLNPKMALYIAANLLSKSKTNIQLRADIIEELKDDRDIYKKRFVDYPDLNSGDFISWINRNKKEYLYFNESILESIK